MNIKKFLVPGIIVLFVIIVIMWAIGINNGMVTREQKVIGQWAQVENVYQRRADLIPNLVATVKGYADFEKSTLTEVVEARAKATSVQINPQNLDANSLQQFQQAQDGLGSALGRLMVVIERYPDLKANQNFLDLQAQLEGSENRIAVERKRFVELTMEYNIFVKRFPNKMFAGIFGFEEKPTFEASEGAEKPPVVEF